jgi:hypothetical protein
MGDVFFWHELADFGAATFPSAMGCAADAVGALLPCVLVPFGPTMLVTQDPKPKFIALTWRL